MNESKTLLTITASIIIRHTGDYAVLRDEEIEKLESNGWLVTVEEEQDE